MSASGVVIGIGFLTVWGPRLLSGLIRRLHLRWSDQIDHVILWVTTDDIRCETGGLWSFRIGYTPKYIVFRLISLLCKAQGHLVYIVKIKEWIGNVLVQYEVFLILTSELFRCRYPLPNKVSSSKIQTQLATRTCSVTFRRQASKPADQRPMCRRRKPMTPDVFLDMV